jgi:glycosyltransferase involved in cell wall biosynthesis
MSVSARARVLYVEPFYWTGGPHNVLRNLLEGLDRDSFDPYAVVPRHGEATEQFGEIGVPVERLIAMHNIGRKGGPVVMAAGGLKSAIGAVQVALFARSRSADLVHTNNETCLSGPLGARLAGKPSVVHVHGLGFSRSKVTATAVVGILNATADRVVAVSSVVADALRKNGVKDNKIRVVHNGIDTSRYRPGLASLHLRGEFQLETEQLSVGMIGGLEPRKGHKLFLEAAALVCKQRKNVRFFIVGEPVPGDSASDRYQREVHALSGSLGLKDAVVFTGGRTDVPNMLAMLDIVVQPSTTEAAPLVPLESMSAGTPVVATDVGGNREEVADQETGILVPPGDASGIARAVVTLLDSPELRARMGEAGRVRVEAEFSTAAMAHRIEDLYRDLWADLRKRTAAKRG